MTKPKYFALGGAAVVVALVALAGHRTPPQARTIDAAAGDATKFTVKRRDFINSVRLNGTVEAVEATTISTPRLAGQNNNSLVIQALVRAGQAVKPGDLLVEFDRQEQLRNSLDRQAEL